MKSGKKIWSLLIPAAILIYVFTMQSARSVPQTTGDADWEIYVASSIIHEGNMNLDEYRDVIASNNGSRYALTYYQNHYYSIYPLGAALLAVPGVLFTEYIVDPLRGSDLLAAMHKGFPLDTAKFIAGFIVALTAVVVYLIGCQLLPARWTALELTLVFSFCTSAWSTAATTLWQHGPSALMLSIALLLVLKARGRPPLIQYAALPLMFSYVIRPTNLIAIFFFTAYVALQYRRFLWRYLAWLLAVAVPFLMFNLLAYSELLHPYYRSSEFTPDTALSALAGNLISPGRGLFLFTPVLLMCFYGIYLKVRYRDFNRLDYCLAGIIVAHWFVISLMTPHSWVGGYAFGPRYFTDMLPFFIYFLAPVLAEIGKSRDHKRMILGAAFIILAVISLMIHANGALNPAPMRWNTQPLSIDKFPERVWDWGDPQFLRLE